MSSSLFPCKGGYRVLHLILLHVGETVGHLTSFCRIQGRLQGTSSRFVTCRGAFWTHHIFMHAEEAIQHFILFCCIQESLLGTASHFPACRGSYSALHLVFCTGRELIRALHHVSLHYRALPYMFFTAKAARRTVVHVSSQIWASLFRGHFVTFISIYKLTIRARLHFPPL